MRVPGRRLAECQHLVRLSLICSHIFTTLVGIVACRLGYGTLCLDHDYTSLLVGNNIQSFHFVALVEKMSRFCVKEKLALCR